MKAAMWKGRSLQSTWLAIRGVVALLLTVVLSGCFVENEPVDADSLALLLRATDFEQFGYEFERVERFETVHKKRYFDGSHEIEYTFEPGTSFYLYSLLSIESDTTSAVMTYKATSVGFNVGYGGDDLDLIEDDAFYSYGDASRFARLTHKGEEVGNLFMTRIDKRVYAFICVGTYFEDAALWAELIEPRLIAFEAYRP